LDRQADHMRLPSVQQIRFMSDNDLFDLHLFAGEKGMPLLDLLGKNPIDFGPVERGERQIDRLHKVVPDIGEDTPERRSQTREAWYENVRDTELARDRHRVERPCSAKRHHRKVSRIVPLLDRNEANGAGQLVDGDIDNGGRAGNRIEAKTTADLLLQNARDFIKRSRRV